MFSIDIDIDKVMNDVHKSINETSKKIEIDSRRALTETANDVKNLVWNNMSKKKNAYNETMEPEEKSTIARKGFSSPLRDTTRMQRGLKAHKVSEDEYSIEFTEKNVIYAKYLNNMKNWQVLRATDYIIRNAIKMFKKNYNNGR